MCLYDVEVGVEEPAPKKRKKDSEPLDEVGLSLRAAMRNLDGASSGSKGRRKGPNVRPATFWEVGADDKSSGADDPEVDIDLLVGAEPDILHIGVDAAPAAEISSDEYAMGGEDGPAAGTSSIFDGASAGDPPKLPVVAEIMGLGTSMPADTDEAAGAVGGTATPVGSPEVDTDVEPGSSFIDPSVGAAASSVHGEGGVGPGQPADFGDAKSDGGGC